MKHELTRGRRKKQRTQHERYLTIQHNIRNRPERRPDTMRFVIYPGKSGDWYWKLVAKNNRSIAIGGEGYNSPGNARRAIKTFRAAVGNAPIVQEKPMPQEDDNGAD